MPSYEEVEGLEPIGRGGFSEVRFCFRSDDGAPFAKKILIQKDDDSQRRFRREVEILHLLAGPKIMPIVDADLDVRPPFYTDSESVVPSMTTSVGARSFYETECDPGHLQEAIRSGLALRTYNLTIVVGSLFVVSVVSVRRCGAFPAAAGIHVAGGVLTWRICADDYRRIVVSC